MRYRLARVVRHPSYVGDWWLELPMRHRWWWRELLFAPGAGWLTWSHDYRSRTYYGDQPDFEEWAVFPPLHRVWFYVRDLLGHPAAVRRGDLCWREYPSIRDIRTLRDEDRSNLWR